MFKRLLVTTDGSEFSLHAVRLAAALARRLEATCTIVTVTEDPLADEVELLERRYAEQASKALHAARQVASEAGIEAATEHVTRSNRVRGILRAAERLGSDLIVIGSHGSGGFERLILGSTAKRLLSQSHVPVLVVRGEHSFLDASGTVLVAIDGSEQSQRAANVAADLAKAIGVGVTMATVVSEPDEPGMGATHWGLPIPLPLTDGQRRDYRQALNTQAAKLLKPAEDAAVARGIRPESKVLFARHPADGIVEAAQGCDLIVMGSHGRRGLGYMALGSVAHEIVTRSDRPVLIVK